MVVKVSPEELPEAIQKRLEDYKSDLTKKVNEKLEDVAKDTAEKLRQGGPYNERTGKYTPDWDYKERNNASSVLASKEYSVYNKKHYQLTHLLEKGHLSRSGTRVRPFEHIYPAEQEAEKEALEKVEDAVKEAGE